MTDEATIAKSIQKLTLKMHNLFAGKRLNVCLGALASMFSATLNSLTDDEFDEAVKMFSDSVKQIRAEVKQNQSDEVARLPL